MKNGWQWVPLDIKWYPIATTSTSTASTSTTTLAAITTIGDGFQNRNIATNVHDQIAHFAYAKDVE